MQRVNAIIQEEAGEPAVIRQRQSTLSANRQSGSNRTSLMMSSLIRQSLAGASMLRQPDGVHCSLCGRVHRGPCRVEAPSAPRPKSVFVKSSSSADDNDDWPWMARDSSRRASIDTSELGDGYYSTNIWDSGSFDPSGAYDRNKVIKPKTPVGEQEQRQQQQQQQQEQQEQLEREYANPNIDRGYAWVILAVVFLINASTFGSARAYGLIFDKLAREGGQTRAQAATPFTVMGAIENMSGPVCGCLLALTGSWRLTVLGGSILVTLGHLFAALGANSQLGQLLAMGFVTGFGLSFISISFFQVNNAYFVRYRSIAFGIGLTGATIGTYYISKACAYFLKEYEGTRACYLILCAFIAPNIPLALLLKPIKTLPPPPAAHRGGSKLETSLSASDSSLSTSGTTVDSGEPKDRTQQVPVVVHHVPVELETKQHCEVRIDETLEVAARAAEKQVLDDNVETSPWTWIKLVVKNPYFHLIWPTQMLFCWFNFVFGMIAVDFSKDRGMSEEYIGQLIPGWAVGQFFGRVILSSLVDLKLITNKSFTIVTFLAIGLTTFLLNNTRAYAPAHLSDLTIFTLLFVMAMFISLLYILLNGLVVHYVEPALQPISFGISSFTGSFFLLPRAQVIGHYRDTFGNYDALLTMFTYVSLCAGFIWLLTPPIIAYLKNLSTKQQLLDMNEQQKEVVILSPPDGAIYATKKGHTNLATTIEAEDLDTIVPPPPPTVGNKTVTFGTLVSDAQAEQHERK